MHGVQLSLARKQAADADGRAEAATCDLARLRKALLDAELEMQTLTQRLGERDRERSSAVEAADSAAVKSQAAQSRVAALEATVEELEKRLASERTKVGPYRVAAADVITTEPSHHIPAAFASSLADVTPAAPTPSCLCGG